MERSDKIRRIYGIAVGAFAVAMGIALICVAGDIYYSGVGTGTIYTREIVSERLLALAIPFIFLIGAVLCGVIFPLSEVKAKHRSEDAVKLLEGRKPSGGEGEEYLRAENDYRKFRLVRYIVWGCALAVTLASAIACLCYLLKTAHFMAEDITSEILRMTANVLPWVAASFVALVAAAVTNGILASKQLKALKTLIKTGNGKPEQKSKSRFIRLVDKVLASNIALWVTRGVIAAVAVTFIILGIFNGGANDVMIKAVNICTECIGLG